MVKPRKENKMRAIGGVGRQEAEKKPTLRPDTVPCLRGMETPGFWRVWETTLPSG